MDTLIPHLPWIALLWPLPFLVLCCGTRKPARLAAWGATAPVPALLAAMFCRGESITLSSSARMPFALELDAPGALLLGVSALLWFLASLDLPRLLATHPNPRRFFCGWLLALLGNLGVFLAADILGFFMFYALVSLPPYVMILHGENQESKRAGTVYLSFALLGEALLLLGFVLLTLNPAGGAYLIRDAITALPNSPWFGTTVLFLLLGFGLKVGLLPGHVWMPVAYTALPTPAAAALSGAGVKAGVIGLIRFLPFHTQIPDAKWLLAAGFLGAFYGVAMGLTQRNPKTILAYSSVSQMGFILALCGIALTAGTATVVMPLAFYAAHHTLVKGGLFLASGLTGTETRRRLPLLILPAAIIGLGMAGLPLTGGMLAKLAVKDFFGDGLAAVLSAASSAATACLMTHLVFRLRDASPNDGSRGNTAPLTLGWIVAAVGAVALPWLVLPQLGILPLVKVLAPSELWKSAWPVALGALAGIWVGSGNRLPRVPVGDLLHVVSRFRAPGTILLSRIVSGERILRRWEVSCILLVAAATGLALLI